MSPASPEYAISVCLLRGLVLSSATLRTVAPLMAALEAAMMVKSLPVIPSNTSLPDAIHISHCIHENQREAVENEILHDGCCCCVCFVVGGVEVCCLVCSVVGYGSSSRQPSTWWLRRATPRNAQSSYSLNAPADSGILPNQTAARLRARKNHPCRISLNWPKRPHIDI